MISGWAQENKTINVYSLVQSNIQLILVLLFYFGCTKWTLLLQLNHLIVFNLHTWKSVELTISWFSLNHFTFGVGWPITRHSKRTFWPSTPSRSLRSCVNLGGTTSEVTLAVEISLTSLKATSIYDDGSQHILKVTVLLLYHTKSCPSIITWYEWIPYCLQ